MTEYGMQREVNLPFDDALQAVRTSLANQGFGVLTEIDVQAVLKKKLDADMERYVILGACHPPSAYEALQAEQQIGLLLPCNVIIYEVSGAVFVCAIRPTIAMQMIKNDRLGKIALDVEKRLRKVVGDIR